MSSPRDPYRYFRLEAAELLEGLGRDVLALERGDVAAARRRIMRGAHTLKGAARVVGQRPTAELAHRLEGCLASFDEAAGFTRAQVDEAVATVDAMRLALASLDGPSAAAPPAPGDPRAFVASAPEVARAPAGVAAAKRPGVGDAPPINDEARRGANVGRAPAESVETIRVEVEALDQLLRAVTQSTAELIALRTRLADLDAVANGLRSLRRVDGVGPGAEAAVAVDDAIGRKKRLLDEGLSRASRELDVARRLVDELRLVRAGTAFGAFERAVYDAAREVGREVEVAFSGGDVRLEQQVLTGVRDALVHVVRNAVVHGIEPAVERRAAGKRASGRVEVEVARRGRRAVFTCRDDGRGVDWAAVRRVAVRQGAVGEDVVESSPELAAALFTSGVTTAREVSELAGRGVGLDVVRAVADKFKGETWLTSEAGRGATLTLSVALSMTSVDVLAVRAGGALASIPVDAVARVFGRHESSDVVRSPAGDALLVEGRRVPLVSLAALFALPPAPEARATLIVRHGSDECALVVDEVLGVESVVVRPLPAAAGALALADGVHFDAEGVPRVMLSAEGVVRAGESGPRPPRPEAPAAPARVLVIDDSLTTRMLEQSILESAGFQVDLATSAEEGIAKARETSYVLFVVDVEMPGMSGFDFVATTRRDPVLARVPAVLVTSRAAPEDLARGREVGASDYIVKSEFDQARLLRAARQAAGRAGP